MKLYCVAWISEDGSPNLACDLNFEFPKQFAEDWANDHDPGYRALPASPPKYFVIEVADGEWEALFPDWPEPPTVSGNIAAP